MNVPTPQKRFITIIKKKVSPSFFIILVILAACIIAGSSRHILPFLDIIELKTIDLRFVARGEKSPGRDVVLAVIDEKSLEKEGKWIWPRKKIAALVQRLVEAGARTIVFDIVFSEPDNTSVAALADLRQAMDALHIENPALKAHADQLIVQTDNDQHLAAAIAAAGASGTAVVLGHFFHIKPDETAHITPEILSRHQATIAGAACRSVQYTSEKAFLNTGFLEVFAPESNIPVIAEATPYSGYFNMVSDKDGVIRWVPGIFQFNNTLYAHLSMNALAAYLDRPLTVFVDETGVSHIQIGDIRIPTDELGRIMVNYRGRAKTFPHIPVTDILNRQVDPARLKDKLVLVGVTATGVYDLRVTPFDTDFPGVEINANLMDSILARDFLHQPVQVKLLDIAAMLLLGGLLGWLIPKIKVISGFMTAIALLTGYILVCVYFFSTRGIVLNTVYPAVTIVLMYISLSVYRYVVEEKQKRFIKNAFSTYLAPAVVDQLIASPDRLMLGGEERQITAFFSDVAGFTSISEKLAPDALVELLNEFLTEMSDIILDQKGMVDKYEGDAIIAMFGAPNDLENHAQAACAATIKMQNRLSMLREKWEKEKNLTIRMRAGLCSGPAVVGNMGSKNRMDYTMMGDTVNTAARLEGVNKVYGTFSMISETTYEAAKAIIFARELDAINVVGKTIPVKIYELIGFRDQADDNQIQGIRLYENGLNAYRQRQWDLAIGFFEQAMTKIPDDPPSRVMMARCRAYQSDPPAPDWNGAYVMQTK